MPVLGFIKIAVGIYDFKYFTRGRNLSAPQYSKQMNTTVIASKFVKWEVPELNTLKNSKAYLLREKLNTGNKLTREEKNWITEKVNHNTYFKNAIPLQGYRFDFSDILKTYVVKQYGQYQEYKAIDRTSLRAMIYGRIDKIIEDK